MPVWLSELSIEAPSKLAQQKACDPSSGVDGRQDEKRFEHYREVIPVLHQPAQTRNSVEDFRDAQRQRQGASGAPAQVLLAGLVLLTIVLLVLKVDDARGLVVNHVNI